MSGFWESDKDCEIWNSRSLLQAVPVRCCWGVIFPHSSKLSKASVTKIKYKISTYKFSCVIKALALQVQKQQPDRQFYSTLQKKKKRKKDEWQKNHKQHSTVLSAREVDIFLNLEGDTVTSIIMEKTATAASNSPGREKKKQTECQATRTSARSNHINCFSGWT